MSGATSIEIDPETLAVLGRCQIAPRAVVLPAGKLKRDLYDRVNAVLAAAGGKWNRSTKSHHFEDDATEILEQAILTGTISRIKQELGIFYTPPELAAKAAGLLRLDRSGLAVLEPSAGMGALAKAVDKVAQRDGGMAYIDCFDILPKHVSALRAYGYSALCVDFLQEQPDFEYRPYDRIIMNPPFAKAADAAHFLHALGFLKPGGRIVAIMSAGLTFRDLAAYRLIRELIRQDGGSIEVLPAGSFKESGTGVNAVLVIYDKPEGSVGEATRLRRKT